MSTDGTTVLRYQDHTSFPYEIAAAGTYYLWVQAYSSSATGVYALTVTDLGRDDHADGTASATSIATDGTAKAGVIETPGDEDWFVFAATNGLVYQVTITGMSASSAVFRADGTTVVTSSTSSSFTVSVSSDGQYYLRIRHSSSSSTGSYAVRVQE